VSISGQQSKVIMRRAIEALFNHAGNIDTADECYAPDYLSHTPPYGDLSGLEAAKGFALAYRQAFPDLQTTIEDMVAEGDKVVARWRTSGTHQGETEAFGPPTGKWMEMTGISIAQFAGGKIVEGWTNVDALGQMQQLGMGPGPEQGVED
jgi:predicted ester cyclase